MARSLLVLVLLWAWASAIQLEPRAAQLSKRIAMPKGFKKLIFSDDFTGKAGTRPSTTRWKASTGTSYPGGPANWGTGEVQTYTTAAANLALSSSNTLLITPTRSAAGNWTSARIESAAAYDFACAAGKKVRVEGRVRLGADPAAAQLGIWPAFWTLGSAFRTDRQAWPAVGEIDVLESVNGAPAGWQTVHCGSNPGGPCGEPNGLGGSTALARGAWTTVAVEISRVSSDWTAQTVTWFVGGTATGNLTGRAVGDQSAWSSLAWNKRFILLDVAVGGSFPDALANGVKTPTAETKGGKGAALEVDYVAVFTS